MMDVERDARTKVRVAAALIGGALLCAPSVAHAGMPFVRLTDMARARLEAISFFLFLILLLTFAVQRLWNALQRDMRRLPRLSYKASLGLVGLWALAMHLVLSMIAGGRELMTPGAWERDGATYGLRPARAAPDGEALALARTQQLERLRVALWQYAATHDGRFPPHDHVADIPEATWRAVDPSGLHYVYVAGQRPDHGAAPLAYEPGIYGRKRMVLMTDGEVTTLALDEIRRRLEKAQGAAVSP